MFDSDPTLAAVREYYGRVLARSADLQTNACCTGDAVPLALRPLLARLPPEVTDRFYGCGSPIPAAIEGRTVLDLGCGSGRDAFLCSALVGPQGRVIGVDMTEAQLDVARRAAPLVAAELGLPLVNTRFQQGYLEDLAGVGLAPGSVDVVISNCVLNLSPDKPRAFREILRVLKPGGELLFSDVFAGRRVPRELAEDPVLWGECLSGAMYVEDFRRLMRSLGVLDWRVLKKSRISVSNPELEARVGELDFWSMTLRVFKLDLEDLCEDYGQVATYRGTLAGEPHRFVLDDHHRFEAHRPVLVCGNTAEMLSGTRYAPHFEIRGDRSRHFGPFPCAPAPAEGTPGACC